MQLSNTEWLLIVVGVAVAAWIMSRNKALAGTKVMGPPSAVVDLGVYNTSGNGMIGTKL